MEIKETGIKCDYCDWKDETIKSSELKNWLNKLCPKCGENLLTEEDFRNAMIVENAINFLNNVDTNDIDIDLVTVKKMLETIGVSGIENIEDLEKDVNVTIDTHKKIQINIEKSKENDLGLER